MATNNTSTSFSHNICSCTSFSTCLGATFCFPCLYGRTQHRLDTYPIPPTSSSDGWFGLPCALACVSAHFGFACVPVWMQRDDIRKRYNIDGNGCTDCLASVFCTCCAAVQHENEVRERGEKEALMAANQGYTSVQGGMEYKPPPSAATAAAAPAAAVSSNPGNGMETGRVQQQYTDDIQYGGSAPPAYPENHKN